MSRKPLGPGPGAYGLPTTIGFKNHDVRKTRNPQYSIRLRTQVIEKNTGPGPGKYTTQGLNRYGNTGSQKYTMGHKNEIIDKFKSPGPAAYEVHKRPYFNSQRAPAFTMVGRNHYENKQNTPGPNMYKYGMNTKRSVPAYTMGLLNINNDKARSPGPAQYGPVNLNFKLRQNPIYSMAGRHDLVNKNKVPGANAYDLTTYKPGRRGEAYTFGVKHHDFAPPMIIECDNI